MEDGNGEEIDLRTSNWMDLVEQLMLNGQRVTKMSIDLTVFILCARTFEASIPNSETAMERCSSRFLLCCFLQPIQLSISLHYICKIFLST